MEVINTTFQLISQFTGGRGGCWKYRSIWYWNYFLGRPCIIYLELNGLEAVNGF